MTRIIMNMKPNPRSVQIARTAIPLKTIVTLAVIILFATPISLSAANPVVKSTNAGVSMVPEALVELPFEGEPEYAIIVETRSQQLFLFSYGETVQEVLRVKCSTGKNIGPKNKSGDSKTPEGIYFLKKQFLEKDLAPIYGSRALTTDYPNELDRVFGKNGDSIWIHGTNKALTDRDSNGCIVLQNQDVDRLSGYVTLNRTPVIITEKINYRPSSQIDPQQREIMDIVTGLAAAVRTGTFHDYLSYFSYRYLPDIAWWTEWSALREKAGAKKLNIDLVFKNIYILKYQQVYMVLFDQFINVNGKNAFAGKRKIFIGTDSALKIIGEEYQLLPNDFQSSDTTDPLVAVAAPMLILPDTDTQIVRLIDKWLAAWSAKNIEVYQKCYSTSFLSPDGKGLDAWVAHKKELNRKYKHIKVTRGKLKITWQSGYATVRFLQSYASSGFNARGKKLIVIRNEGGEWKIYRETWEKQ